MLKAFPAAYQKIEDWQDGPKAVKKAHGGPLASDDIESAVRSVLHKNGQATNYDGSDKQLMVWYAYLFLNRGKPISHIAALSRLSDKELQNNLPDEYKRMIQKVENKLHLKEN